METFSLTYRRPGKYKCETYNNKANFHYGISRAIFKQFSTPGVGSVDNHRAAMSVAVRYQLAA